MVHNDVHKIIASIEAAIPTMEVKTASATPSGNKVQARVAYIYEGKKKIGYVTSNTIKPNGRVLAPTTMTLVYRVFRLSSKIEDLGYPKNSAEYHSIQSEVNDAITTYPEGFTGLQLTCKQIKRKMQDVVQSGKLKIVKRAKNQIKAREDLASVFSYALASGISEDELHNMLREAIVSHVMDN